MRYRFLRFPGGRDKAVTLSYDDGNRNDIKFSDIITKYGLKCTFNLNGEACHGGRGINTEEIKEYILKRGHEVAVHGAMHIAEGSARPIDGIRDVLNCRLELEEKFGMIIRGMAYPDSGIRYYTNFSDYPTVREYLKNLDIAYSRTLGGDNSNFRLPEDWYCWMPTAHHDNPEIMEYIDKFLEIDLSKSYIASRWPKLFYMWGHSSEFEGKNNWSHLEDICKKLAGHDEMWYATNIEIYNYVEAYKALVFSADGKIIYNPTLYKIWFDIDGTLYSIDPGETLKV